MTKSNMFKVSRTLQDYLICAIWTNELDKFSVFNFAKSSVIKADKDLEKFIQENESDCLKIGFDKIGHNFWLSRNGHGAGFFDLPENGASQDYQDACDRLQNAARKFSNVDAVKHKGRLYLEP